MHASRAMSRLAAAVGLAAIVTASTSVSAQNPITPIRPGAIGAQGGGALFGGGAFSLTPPNPFIFGRGAASGAFGFPSAAANMFGAGRFGNNPYATLSSTSTLPNVANDPFAYNNSGDPYGSGMPYYGGYESPIGGYMRGYADVINSVTKGMIDEQQALMMREYVKREKLETQRRAFDQWLYYRERMPTAEDDRQRDVAIQVRRALNDPPVNDIYSGRAMNVLLDDLGKRLGKDGAPQGVPISLRGDDVVGHLNFTGQENKGNPGMLKYVSTDEGRLPWPLVLTGPQYKTERELLDRLIRTTYKEAEAGRADAGNIESMSAVVQRLQQALTDNIRDLTPNQYGEARRFLGDFDDALTLLRQPNARAYFGSKAPKATTIGDLVQDMLSRGLRFAPATAGDEAAYVAAHRALVMYASAATAAVATTDKAPAPEREK